MYYSDKNSPGMTGFNPYHILSSKELSSEKTLMDLNSKSKRHRRIAQEIERHYDCPVKVCGKKYGSEGSLN